MTFLLEKQTPNVTLGDVSSAVAKGALGAFVQDNWIQAQPDAGWSTIRLADVADGTLQPLCKLGSDEQFMVQVNNGLLCL